MANIFGKKEKYWAGVHLYIEKPPWWLVPPAYTIIRCRYEQATVRDELTIVAKSIIPMCEEIK
jgi:hypothetical protein